MPYTQTRYIFLLRIVLSITDLLLLNIAFFGSFYIIEFFGQLLHPLSYQKYLVLVNLIWIVSSSVYRMYHVEMVKTVEAILRVTWRSLVLNIFIFLLYLTFTNDTFLSREFLFAFYCLLAFFLFLSRFLGSLFEMLLTRQYGIGIPVAILGNNATGNKLGSFFSNSRNFKFMGFLDLENDEKSLFSDSLGTLKTSTIEQLKNAAQLGVKDVYVSLTPKRMPDAKYLLREAEKQCVRLKFVPDFLGSMEIPFNISYLEGFPIITLRKEPLDNMQARFKKRLLDTGFSLLVTVLILSWLVPIIALLIKLDSKGPVFFMQNRAGRGNVTFKIFKFRSMKVMDKSSTFKQASKNDDRITRVGKFLRATSLDEIPQFFNVLLGSMSVVGPRPHVPELNHQYHEIIEKYMVRNFVKPGITGWAQVNGCRGETTEIAQMEERVKYDINYTEKWSVMLDIKIVFMTIFNILKGEENAY
ncbi:MAG: undecaprenyl-phosphate glucose phosphotransferase [Sphingobacteriales bacterium]|jgi:putative colanic acid biosysnthesis UDP-glucose lipid carrier transferase|nr:MAG: undecaprenyl-phosphate glucose phosphotransferase [Sphingobacteriales bacterium]